MVFVRAKGKKVAGKTQREGLRQLYGTIKYNGQIVRRKGDVYDVDCAVTGTNEGSVDDPKCPLLPIFKDIVFPLVAELVGEGGSILGIQWCSKVTMRVLTRTQSSCGVSDGYAKKMGGIGSHKLPRCRI